MTKTKCDGPTNQPTNRRTDRRTDRVTYRVACTRLKSVFCYLIFVPSSRRIFVQTNLLSCFFFCPVISQFKESQLVIQRKDRLFSIQNSYYDQKLRYKLSIAAFLSHIPYFCAQCAHGHAHVLMALELFSCFHCSFCFIPKPQNPDDRAPGGGRSNDDHSPRFASNNCRISQRRLSIQ